MNLTNLPVLNLIISFTVTYLSIPPILAFSRNSGFVDLPSFRKIHKSPTVRLGGSAIFLGLLCSLLFSYIFGLFDKYSNLQINNLVVLITGGTLFFLLGFLDDLKSLSPFLRLILQFLISIILWIQGLRIEGININVMNQLQINYSFTLGIGLFFTCFFIVGIINAFNWIDGLDGLAGGIALIFFISQIFLFNTDQFLIASLIGACMAFLIFNVGGSLLMMGDGGSYSLGYFLSAMSIIASYTIEDQTYIKSINLLIPIFFLFVPLLDMCRVIFVRFLNGRSLFYPDNNHIHHVLLKNGYGKNKILFLILFASSLFSLAGILISKSG